MYIFQLMDFYSASGLSLLWICFFETVAISWFYGASKFAENIESMIGRKPSVFWILCWKVFAPLLMGVSKLNKSNYRLKNLLQLKIPKIALVFYRVFSSTTLQPTSL